MGQRGQFQRITRTWWLIWYRVEDKGKVKGRLQVSEARWWSGGGHTPWDGNTKGEAYGAKWGRVSSVLGPDGGFKMCVWHQSGVVARATDVSVQSLGLTKSHVFNGRLAWGKLLSRKIYHWGLFTSLPVISPNPWVPGPHVPKLPLFFPNADVLTLNQTLWILSPIEGQNDDVPKKH